MQRIQANKLRSFFRSFNFTKGLLIAIAAFTAVAFCANLFTIPIASIVATGILLTSLSDIPGTRKQQLSAMCIAIVLAVVDSILMKFAIQTGFLLLPVLAVLIFLNAYLAIYGFRASLISFSGLLAVIVSFTRVHTGIEIFYYSFYLLCGGGWYIFLQLIFGRYRTYSHVKQLLSEAMHLTALYLEAKSVHIIEANRKQVGAKILSLQNELILKHDEIRNLLLVQEKQEFVTAGSGRSLMIFIELVNVLELAVATPLRSANDPDDDVHFRRVIEITEELLKQIAARYEALSNDSKDTAADEDLENLVNEAAVEISLFKTANTANASPQVLQKLRTLKQFSLQQLALLKTISRFADEQTEVEPLEINQDRNKKFLTRQSYSPRLLLDNFNFSVPIFRHCLRLMVTVVIGYLIGTFFAVQNPYWIALTIMVIMRPGYILTKQRTIYRTVGTLAGAVVAVGIVMVTHNFVIYAVIIFISTTLAFTLTQQNYRAAAFFITIMLLLIYAMITENAFKIIQFRVLDTLLGAGLASAANYFLWPAWEIRGFEKLLINTLQANQVYFQEVSALLLTDVAETSGYRVARKKAFISMGELHAGMERIAQEPISKNKDLSHLEKMVWLQQELLAATAALSTDIQLTEKHTLDAEMLDEIFATDKAQRESTEVLAGFLDLNYKAANLPEPLLAAHSRISDSVSRSVKNDLSAIKVMTERMKNIVEKNYSSP